MLFIYIQFINYIHVFLNGSGSARGQRGRDPDRTIPLQCGVFTIIIIIQLQFVVPHSLTALAVQTRRCGDAACQQCLGIARGWGEGMAFSLGSIPSSHNLLLVVENCSHHD